MQDGTTLLRQLIRETLVSETYGKHAKKVVGRFNDDQPDPRGQAKALEKYHSSESWSLKAHYALRNIPSSIWIIPSWHPGEGASTGRVDILSLDSPDVQRHILKSGIVEEEGGPDEQVAAVNEHLSRGGSLIISISHLIQKDFWPSPWNLVHAMCDDWAGAAKHPLHEAFLRAAVEPAYAVLSKILEECRVLTEENIPSPEGATWKEKGARRTQVTAETKSTYESFLTLLVGGMTMGSARRGKLVPEQHREYDLIAEAFTQSITRPGGLHFKLGDVGRTLREKGYPPETTRLFRDGIKDFIGVINKGRDPGLAAIGDLLRGNVVAVNVVDLPYDG